MNYLDIMNQVEHLTRANVVHTNKWGVPAGTYIPIFLREGYDLHSIVVDSHTAICDIKSITLTLEEQGIYFARWIDPHKEGKKEEKKFALISKKKKSNFWIVKDTNGLIWYSIHEPLYKFLNGNFKTI